MAIVNGFGRGEWGQLTWGEPIPVVVTNVAGTTASGSVAVPIGVNATVTGIAGTTAIGTVAAQGFAVVGVSAVASTIGLGDETLITNNNLSVSGFEATVNEGTVDPDAKAVVYATGIQGEALLKSVQVWGLINTDQTPNYATISGSQTPNWEEVA